MFDENFSFASARSPSLDSSTAATTRDSSRAVSPCSVAAPFPTNRLSVTDLAAQFADQRIQRDAQICYDPCETYASNDDEADWAIPLTTDNEINPLARSRTFPQRSQSPSRRIQRQVNTRLLCTASHRRDIAALVSRMVDSSEQCCVSPAESLTPPAVNEEDEGYNSSDESMNDAVRATCLATARSRAEYRRSSEMNTTGAYVNKSLRFRKDRNQRRLRSSDNAA